MSKDEQLEAFRSAVEDAPPLWRSIDVRAVAVNVGGEWWNVLTRCRLRAEPPDQIPRLRYLVRTKRVISLQHVDRAEVLPQLLKSLSERRVSFESFSIRYDQPNRRDADDPSPYGYGMWFDDLTRPSYWAGVRWHAAHPANDWPMLLLSGAGSTVDELRGMLPWGERDIDAEIHASRTPMDGLLGIAEHIVGLRPDRETGIPATIRVEAPFEARFESTGCRLEQGELQLRIQAGSQAAAEHMDVGCIAMMSEELSYSGTISLSADDWQHNGLLWTGFHRLEVGQATHAMLLLRIGNRRIDTLRLSDQSRVSGNPRFAAYAAVDPELQVLRANLIGKRPNGKADSEALEYGTARLLALLGFQSIRLGPGGELSDAADVIAFDPYSDVVLLVECTTGAIDTSGKLGKLHLRASELRSVLHHHTIHPVLVTSSNRAGIAPGELEKAAHSRTSVWGQEDLQDFLEMAVEGTPTTRILKAVYAKIPALPDSEAPRHVLWPRRR